MRALFVFSLLALFAVLHGAPVLRLEKSPAGYSFQLTGTSGKNPWVLQHSRDGSTWEHLLFFAPRVDGSTIPNLEIQSAILAEPEATRGFFRASELPEEDIFLERFLSERARWRLSGNHNYAYVLQQWAGRTFWRGTIDVVGRQVTSFETLEFMPPFLDLPEVPSIERLFGRIAEAIAQDAFEINVTWHPTLGYPVSCYIDPVEFIADEESGWNIEGFTPGPSIRDGA